MGTSKNRPLPPDLERGRRRFEAWRARRKPRSRIPRSLWKLAVRLASRHGLSRTATVLRLDYYSLKARAEDDTAGAQPATTSFVELAPPVFLGKQCHVELNNGAGATMRLRMTGYDAADLEALVRGFGSQR